MTETDDKQELTSSSPQPSLPSSVMTDSDSEAQQNTEETKGVEKTIVSDIDEERESNIVAEVTEKEAKELADTDEDTLNIKAGHDLTNVIFALQNTISGANKLSKEQGQSSLQEELVKEEDIKRSEPQDTEELGTIPEESDSSLINEESAMDKTEAADIDIPLDNKEVQVNDTTVGDNSLSLPPLQSTPIDLNIATHFEKVRISIDVPADQNMADFVTPPTPGIAPNMFGKNSCDDGISDDNDDDLQDHIKPKEVEKVEEKESPLKKAASNSILLSNIDFSSVKPNFLTPRDQEKYDEGMMTGISCFFNNKFSDAKSIFEEKAKEDPLYSLGLGSMAFIKAITSYNLKDVESALSKLNETYLFASAQIDAASAKKPLKDSVSHYFTNLMGSNSTHLPTNTRPLNRYELREQEFMSSGAHRAHIIKAECGLLMAIIFLSMETVVGYLKAGLNLRRAYSSYSLVWQEYKKMGQNFNKYLDQDTISAIQFGIGSVHLLLSSLPVKILKMVSAFGWTADKQLGFALLKLCLEGKRIRSPLASLILLSYYTTLASHVPQILTEEHIQPAIECLLDAQKSYPNSTFFLLFAGRVSRLARNLPLSAQSFAYAFEVCQGDWAETTMGQLATFEIAFTSAMSLDWASAAIRIIELDAKYNSPAFLKYFYGACMEMLGNRTEAILAFAESPGLVDKRRNSQTDMFVQHRAAFFERSGYQDLDFSLPALEILFIYNAFPCMSPAILEKCIELIENALGLIYEREKLEYDIRKVELVPSSATPDYYDQRGTLLLMKASLLSALNRHTEGIVHLNWIIDNKDKLKHTNWLLPFAYWESGIVCWGTKELKRARALWESTLTYSNYDFEYRLATCLNLAIQHAVEIGVPETAQVKPEKGKTTHGRKRLSVVTSKSTGSIISSK